MNRATIAYRLATCLGILAAVATAGADGPRNTATVAVRVSVLPFAEVELDVDSVEMVLPPGPGHAAPVYVGGTIRTNVGASVYALVTKPQGAPGDWTAQPEVRSVPSPGVYRFDEMLQIIVWNLPADYPGGSYVVGIAGNSAAGFHEIQTPAAGVATVTVVPH